MTLDPLWIFLWILPFTEKVMCVYPTAPFSYLTAMPTQTHTDETALSRTNSVQIPHWGRIRRMPSVALVRRPAGSNLWLTPPDLWPPGLKVAPYRPQGTASSHSPNERSTVTYNLQWNSISSRTYQAFLADLRMNQAVISFHFISNLSCFHVKSNKSHVSIIGLLYIRKNFLEEPFCLFYAYLTWDPVGRLTNGGE